MSLDTIVAPATPLGRSALAIVRIDGPEAAAILGALSRSTRPEPRRAVHVRLHEVGVGLQASGVDRPEHRDPRTPDAGRQSVDGAVHVGLHEPGVGLQASGVDRPEHRDPRTPDAGSQSVDGAVHVGLHEPGVGPQASGGTRPEHRDPRTPDAGRQSVDGAVHLGLHEPGVGPRASGGTRPDDITPQTPDARSPVSDGPTPDTRHPTPLLDDSIAILYAAPASFTGNDLVELTLHGNPLLVERVVAACVALGARMAEPGEFTERAVLNGKLDLVQAESIADLINARTALQAKLSLSNLEGLLSRKAAAIRQALLEVISRLEAALDFSEEGYEFISRAEAASRIDAALRDASVLADTYRRGHATVAGLNAVILGRPNAGKSTLLNRLVGSDRAIVTPIPGTTRDIVRETLEIGGLPVTLADTAGLRESADVVEGIGIERARAAARSAEVVLYLVDAACGLTEEDRRELADFPEAHVIYTKVDLAGAPEGALAISAVTDEGVDTLLARLDEVVRRTYAAPEASLVNERQRQAVADCMDALAAAAESLAAGLDEQVVLVDLYRAANALGSLTGAITREDVYTEIFSKFCIGK